jgi:hypothetical protein
MAHCVRVSCVSQQQHWAPCTPCITSQQHASTGHHLTSATSPPRALQVTDTGLRALAAGCKALRCFSARHCSRLSDEALAALAARGQLRELDVSGSPAAGPSLMRSLAQCCKDSLEVLDLSFCRWAAWGMCLCAVGAVRCSGRCARWGVLAGVRAGAAGTEAMPVCRRCCQRYGLWRGMPRGGHCLLRVW